MAGESSIKVRCDIRDQSRQQRRLPELAPPEIIPCSIFGLLLLKGRFQRMNENGNGRESEVEVAKATGEAKIFVVRLKLIATSVSLVIRLTASFVVAAYDGWIRRNYKKVALIKDRIKVHIQPLAHSKIITSFKEAIVYSGKIDSIIHVFSNVSLRPRIKWQKKVPETCLLQPEKSVSCDVLYAPEEGEIRADIIFIHGLHGSVVHTWKQGLWSYRKNVLNSPIEHKYKLDESEKDGAINSNQNGSVSKKFKCDSGFNARKRNREFDNTGEDHDLVLENITDIINNIDDRIKETKSGAKHLDHESEPYSPCWPRDWLPKDCPGIRVIAVNYTTDPFLWRPVWITKRLRTSMTERSEEMEDHLLKLGVGQNPIVWVGHSKGGLFVKQMLVDANNGNDPRLKVLLEQTRGIMFYSVPHRGSSLAHINLPLLRQSIELTEVQKDCQEVILLHNQFMKLYEKNILSAEVYSFVETVLTFMFITNVRVVSVDSADVGFGVYRGVNIDHREICKPLNRECFLYQELANLINRVA